MKTTRTLIAILILFSGHCGYAQQKGSFVTSISFMNEDRVLSCYVPLDYDSTQQYRLMIGLHGSGDNSTNYKNALINSLAWQNIFTNTIFICPDGGGDQVHDFYAPDGDEEVIEASIRFAIQNYSIDTTDILLQGFSLGGRSALKYGLDHPSRFKGLLLNTPAVQDIQDARNVPGPSLIYDYPKASLLPIYITCGMADETYIGVVSSVVEILKENNAKVDFMPVPNLPHSLPDNTITASSLAFIQNPKHIDYDVDVFKIEAKDRYCADFNAKCLIRNTGEAAVNSVKLNIQYGSVNTTYTWNGNLGLFEHAIVSLPTITGINETDSLIVTIGKINGVQTDHITSNNSISKEIQVVTTTTLDLISEGFEADELPAPWITEDNGSLFNWYPDPTASKSGSQSLTNFNSALIFNTTGLESNVLTPSFNLGTTTSPTLSFDLAFNYHKYTPPYFTHDTVFADTLEVLISVDCGATFQRLYKKGGAALATASSPIINALSLQDAFFQPAPNEWRQEIIDLKPYINNPNAFVELKYISGYGGSIYIDNLRIGDGMPTGIDNRKPELAFNMYPNPASDAIHLTINNTQPAKIAVYDNLGKMVLSQQVNNHSGSDYVVDLNKLTNGFYLIEVSNGTEKVSKKLLIHK